MGAYLQGAVLSSSLLLAGAISSLTELEQCLQGHIQTIQQTGQQTVALTRLHGIEQDPIRSLESLTALRSPNIVNALWQQAGLRERVLHVLESVDKPKDDWWEAWKKEFQSYLGFDFDGVKFQSAMQIVCPSPPFQPNQYEISTNRLYIYATRMQQGEWDWNNMRTKDVTGQIIDDPIEIGVTPSGKKIIINGHHRYLAALITDQDIPENAFRYVDVPEGVGTEWKKVDWMYMDARGVYPVLTPPTS